MSAYYNEFDPKAAAWLRELAARGHIAPGDVDERSIAEVRPDDIKGYDQVHLFAGIGGWSYALRLAGWGDDRPVWTGSCPCQPFSVAGKGRGHEDERHLWPEMFRLLRECRPVRVFGEQVAGAVGLGWLDGVRADLEGEGYALGAAVLGAHSVGAPHIRQRLFWVADAEHSVGGAEHEKHGEAHGGHRPGGGGHACRVGDPHDTGPQGRLLGGFRPGQCPSGASGVGAWAPAGLIACADGKPRRIPAEPRFFPLAHGVPARVGRLRGYGNAIVPQIAAEFVDAYLDVTP